MMAAVLNQTIRGGEMLASPPSIETLESVLSNEQATAALAAELAPLLRPGDVVALSGTLGAGKTYFARALIRTLAGDPALDVPSPTFTLLQSYELPCGPVVHADFFRVGDPGELREFGWPDIADDAITVVEWPERAGDTLPAERLAIALVLAPELGPNYRRVRLAASGAVASRTGRLIAFKRFLQEAGYDTAERIPVQGDASTRIYERLRFGGGSAILMNAPRRPDGPPVRDGKPYSAIAHLAEDVTPFVAMARALRERGLSAPEVRDADFAEGLLIIEDLGAEPLVAGDPQTAREDRYAVAVDALMSLHRQNLPDTLPVAPSVTYRLPRYDMEALLIEVELLLDWYLPRQGQPAGEEARAAFSALWREALKPAVSARPSWVLRDYHSPNLLWLPEREGVARVGLLDFQDAVMGPPAYDLVSLLQDARVDVPVTVHDALFGRYMKGRHAADRDFDMTGFVALYALMGAQRATKILGIFSRLDRRDGKSQYLAHQPRVWRNLRRSLAHPTLAKLKTWFDAHATPPRPEAG
jgi:N-acetylmuramate 1-kinase